MLSGGLRAATSRSPRDRRRIQRSYRVDFSKFARTFPELRLEWNAERGARELVDAYRRVGLTKEDFDGDRYVRLRRLMALLDDGALDGDLHWQVPVAS